MKRFRAALWVGGIILLFTFGCQQSRPNLVNGIAQDDFQWLDSTRDSQVWNRVLVGLHQELEPDDPQKVPEHYAATQYKYIYKIGVFRTAALVIVGNRETKDSPGYDYFSSYSYDLRDGSKSAIVTEPPRPPGTYPEFGDVLWMFEVAKLAHFDRSPAPDVVFKYDSCSECEAEHFLASFEYMPGKGWVARRWDNNEKNLLLMETPEPDDNALSADYLFKIKDWNGDGFDDVAVRRREVTQVSKRRQETDDSTTIYRSENGKLVGHPVTDSTERTNINAELCSDSEPSFCH